ncbi:MAG: NUDIX hydrolase [Burkholderiaceae bacterium]
MKGIGDGRADAPAASGADEHLIEHRLRSESVFDGRMLKARRDEVRLPDGKPAQREYIVHPGAVMIVPIADDGKLVVERQHRYPIGAVLVEFPAGKLDPNETTLQCARRELAEETGYRAREWAPAGRMHNAPAYSTEFIEVWFARGLVAGERRLDEGEFVEAMLIEEKALFDLAARGELTDAKTLVGLLRLQQWRCAAWEPVWQAGP